VEERPVEKVFVRFAPVVHLHVGGQVVRTTGEHPVYAFDRGWVPVVELSPGEWVLTAAGDWRAVEEVYATGQWEVVYNLRVADHHTYFVGDYGWGWALWAHNTCVIVSRKVAIFTDPDTGIPFERGQRVTVHSDVKSYNATWFKPRTTDDMTLTADACADNTDGTGNDLQTQVTAFAAAWAALPPDSPDKYTASQLAAIGTALTTVNTLRAQYGLAAIDPNDFLTGASVSQLPATATQADKDSYGKALRMANSMRASAEGIYVHRLIGVYCQNRGYTYSTTGIDITVQSSTGRTLRYEVLRDTSGSWNAHFRDNMTGNDWRALTYT
jgi:hypothetical protein